MRLRLEASDALGRVGMEPLGKWLAFRHAGTGPGCEGAKGHGGRKSCGRRSNGTYGSQG